MRVTNAALVLFLVFGGWAASSATRADEANGGKAETAKLRVGTFDSRAVAVAYFNSEMRRQQARQMMEEYKKAKTANDQQKIKELEAKRRANETQIHRQGFSTASVANILAEIKDQMPGIAKEAGVDVIVSKWEIAYQSDSAEFVDVTGLLIKPFQPDKKVLGWINDLQKRKPIALQDLEKELTGHLEERPGNEK